MSTPASSALLRPFRAYYGWWVLCATAVTEMLAMGTTSYAAGLFVLPLERDLHLSRGAASSAVPILFAGGALIAPLVGYALDRVAVQWVIVVGALMLSGAFALIAATSSPAVMAFALFVPAAIGFVSIGTLTTSTLVSRWFYRRRGLAFGIAAVATSGGGILVFPLGMAIIAYGWRTALTMEAACIALVVCVLALGVIRNGPAELGLEGEVENAGRPAAELTWRTGAQRAPVADMWKVNRILSSRNFWAIAVPLAAISGMSQAIVITVIPYGAQLGFAPAATTLLISAFAISAAATKVTSGVLADYVDRKSIMFLSTVVMSMSCMIFVVSTAYLPLFVACCLAGIALGCVLPSSSALVAACFGSPSFGSVLGWMYVAAGISAIGLVQFAGAVFDHSGSYQFAFLSFVAMSALAGALALLVRAP